MSDENLIHVLNKRLKLYQVPGGFRTSMDSVMLAAACPALSGQSILDLGCGVGSAGLCVLKRVKGTTLTGVDIQDDHIDVAKKNAQINSFEDRSTWLCSDLREASDFGMHDHVIANPPYKDAGGYIHSPSHAKAKAMGHFEDGQTLQHWVTCAWHHIKGQGSLTMIHEAGQTDMLIHTLFSPKGGRRFGSIEIIPLYPKENVEAKRVIIRAYKHKKSAAKIHHGIIMHKENGEYSEHANSILREMLALN